jgi:hypothetical protein
MLRPTHHSVGLQHNTFRPAVRSNPLLKSAAAPKRYSSARGFDKCNWHAPSLRASWAVSQQILTRKEVEAQSRTHIVQQAQGSM